MTLSKKERSKINKSNRAKGYRVEYDSIVALRKRGYWVRRMPSKQQRNEMSPVDYFYWDPNTQIFGFGQAKYHKKLLTQVERDKLSELNKKYRCEIMFSWRDNGIKFQCLNPIPEIQTSASLR